MNKKILITGIGIVSPVGIGKENFWNAIVCGKSGIDKISSFDTTDFECKIAGEVKDFDPLQYIDKKSIRRMERFTQFALASAIMAIEDAKINLQKLDNERVGVIIGSGIGGIGLIEKEHSVLQTKGPSKITPFLIPKLITNIAPGEIAIKFGFTGPNYAVSSACASSNHAFGDALRILRYGDADMVIAGGTESTITPLCVSGFTNAGALTLTHNDNPQSASKPFDKNRDGFVIAEGSGIVVLETEEHFLKRNGEKVYGEFAGYGATDDAYHITAPSPDGKAVIKAMKVALEDAKISPQQIDYINAHGTSTKLNDKVETFAIKQVFGEYAYKIPISSTKSMIGHLLGAAGAGELIATLLCMENDMVHPTINYQTPDPECDLDYVPNKARPAKIKSAMSNSLGFGGHNAVVVVRKYE